MRAIRKDLNEVPASIRLPEAGGFADEGAKEIAAGNAQRRQELLAAGHYIGTAHYDAGFKSADVRAALEALYHGKCAYCEQKAEELHIEHYRPKSKYHWLAYSWDNLLLACVRCNRNKGDQFPIANTPASASVDDSAALDFHALGAAYDTLEEPQMVNPERESDPALGLIFEKSGAVSSEDARYAQTIARCRLSRTYLQDNRRLILDEFQKELQAINFVMAMVEPAVREQAFSAQLNAFIQKANDPRSEYSAFRRYIVRNWLLDVALSAK